MRNKKRPQYIEKQLKEINDIFRNKKLKWNDHYENDLFSWFTDYLLHNGWYRGFNVHYDKEVKMDNEETKIIRALAGPDYEKKDYYIQIW